MVCAAEAIWLILASNDCDGDGKIDCEDRACNLNKLLNPEASLQNESEKEYMTAFMARYWKISNDRAGEPVQYVSGKLLSCVHNMMYGRNWWRHQVKEESFEIIDMGIGSAILPLPRDSTNKGDIFSDTINVKSLLLVHISPIENKTYSDDPLAGENLNSFIEFPATDEFKLLNTLKNIQEIEEVIKELENATKTVGFNSTADDDTLFKQTRKAEDILVKTQGESSRILEEVPDNVEVMWGRAKLPQNGTRKQVESILAVGAVQENDSRGFILHCPEECDYLNSSTLKVISRFEDPNLENVEAGALLSKNRSRIDVRYIFSTYKDATAFGFGQKGEAVFDELQEGTEWRLHSIITMFSMWSTNGTQVQLSPGEHIDITLRPRNYSNNGTVGPKMCVSRQNSNGTWTNKNCRLQPGLKFDTCQCEHLTHFVLLIDVTQKGANSKALEIISVVGCGLSLCAILGIVFIAACAPHWRQKTENKVLLNLTTAVALMMVAFLAATYTELVDKELSCTTLGAVLHFAVLATFLWSLAAAITHYLRFTSIIGPSIVSRLTLKAGLVAWGLPFVSVAVVASVWPESYSRGKNHRLCYPKELAFYITVLGPIVLVLAVNMILFILILRTLGLMSCLNKNYLMKTGETQHSKEAEQRIMLRKALVCVAFLFLFGLTWLLGIYSFSVVCTFFACVVTSLQGVVLFVFFAVGEQRVRQQLNRRFHRTVISRMVHGRWQPFTRFGDGGAPSSSTSQPVVMAAFSSEAKPAPPTDGTKEGTDNSL